MYKLVISVINPMTGDAKVDGGQFDPGTMTPQKWNGLYPRFQQLVSDVQTQSTGKEPTAI